MALPITNTENKTGNPEPENRQTADGSLQGRPETTKNSAGDIEFAYTSLPVLMFSISPDFKFINTSTLWQETIGYSSEEIYSVNMLDLISGEFRPQVRETLLPLFGKPGQCRDIACRFVAKNGEIIEALLSSVTLKDMNSGEYKLIITLTDITKGKKAEEDLKKTEVLLKSISDQIADVVFCSDKSGFITFVSPSCNNVMAYTQEEMTGRHYSDYIAPDYVDKAIFSIRKALENNMPVKNLELKLVRKDRSVFFAELNAIGLQYGDTEGITGIIRDITQRKEAEYELLNREEKMNSIFRVAPIGIGVMKDRVLNEVNSMLCEMTGYSPGELIGKNIRMLYASDQGFIAAGKDKYWKYKEHKAGSMEAVWKKKNGEIIIVQLASAPLDFADLSRGDAFTVINITKQKEAEKDLKRSEAHFRELIQSAPTPVVLIRKGHIIYANEAFRLLINIAEDITLSDMQIKSFIAEEDIAAIDEFLETEDNTKEKTLTLKSSGRKIDGTDFPYEMICSKVFLADGLSLIAHISDITDRWNMEKLTRIISEIQNSMINIDNVKDLYSLVSEKIHELVGDCISLTTKVDETEGIARIMAIHGLDMPSEKIAGIMGVDPLKMSYKLSEMTETDMVKYKSGKLETISDGLHTLMAGRIPKVACSIVEKLLRIKFTFVQGIVNKGNYMGGLILFTRRDIPQLKNIIEEIVTLASTTMSRIYAEEALKRSRKRFRDMTEMLPQGVYEANREGFITYANKCALEMFGYTQEDDLSKINVINIIAPEDRTRVLASFTMIATERKQSAAEYTALRKDLTQFSVFISSSPIIFDNEVQGVRGIVMDITSRKSMENALKESEEKYKAAFLTSPDSISITNLEGMYQDVNDGFCRLTGYSREEVIGRTTKDINIWAVDDHRKKLLDNLLKNGFADNLECLFKMKNLTLKTGLMSARIIHVNGQPHILAIVRDISDRKLMENELIAAKEKAEESDQMKSAFLSNVSHEIRTPLNAIMGFSSLLNETDVNEVDRKQFSSLIKKRSNDLLSIVNNVLDISKIESGQMIINETADNLDAVLLEIYNSFNNRIALYGKTSLTLILNNRLTEDSAYIITDFNRLKQILHNLLSNAFKFTEKGTIEFGCFNSKNNFLTFYVKDTGIGIPEEKKFMIFDRYRHLNETLTRTQDGSGLGLSIAKGLVELLGGNIWVVSEEGVGSQFSFTIPYKPVHLKYYKDLEPREEENRWKDKTVMIVEDEESNMIYLEKMFSNIGVKYLKAYNGSDAIVLFRDNPSIDLVLMDIRLPNISGYEITKTLKSMRPEIPVIAQTAYAMEGDRQKALAAGCEGFISKPYLKSDFMNLISKFL